MGIRKSREALESMSVRVLLKVEVHPALPVLVVMPPMDMAKGGVFHWISSSNGSFGLAITTRQSCSEV